MHIKCTTYIEGYLYYSQVIDSHRCALCRYRSEASDRCRDAAIHCTPVNPCLHCAYDFTEITRHNGNTSLKRRRLLDIILDETTILSEILQIKFVLRAIIYIVQPEKNLYSLIFKKNPINLQPL